MPEPALSEYDLKLDVRDVRRGDENFIFSTWQNKVGQMPAYGATRSCMKCGADLLCIDKNWFYAAQGALIRRLLDDSLVLVACSPHNDDQLYGYIVAEPRHDPPLLHWVLTKDGSGRKGRPLGYRRAGVAQRLMEAAFPALGVHDIVATFRTTVAAQLPERWRLVFRSGLLLRPT